MRVLTVCGSYPPMHCGVGEYTASLVSALAAHGRCEVAVITSPGAAGTDNVIATTTWRFPDIPKIIGAIRSWRPDVIHFQFPAQGYRGPLPFLLPALVALAGYRVVITWHEFLDRARLVFLPNVIVPGAMVVVRPGFRERLAPLLRRLTRRKRIELIPNASTIPTRVLTDDERESLRREWGHGRPLIAFFGFAYRHKGVDLLFRVADPEVHHLVIVGKLDPADEYHREILTMSESPAWRGHVTFTGYRDANGVAEILAAADAVVLPFRLGGGNWNTSIHAAARQGTFTLTTSVENPRFDEDANVYYARPEDVDDMRDALLRHAGRRRPSSEGGDPAWEHIAAAHRALYDDVTGRAR